MEAPTHKPLIDYFESLNANLKDFPEKSFFRQDLNEIMGAIRSGINFPAMAVESPDGDGEGSIEQNSVIGRMFAFTVYMNPEEENFQQQNEMLDLCERIGKKVLARMRYDARVPGHLLHNKFKVSTVKWIKVGPVFTDLLYGYRFTGMIEGSEPLTLDVEDWDDITAPCPS
jgi:hypothetical protein